jgi:hypothetical protein
LHDLLRVSAQVPLHYLQRLHAPRSGPILLPMPDKKKKGPAVGAHCRAWEGIVPSQRCSTGCE